MARSRRLGSVGEVSVWPDPVLHKNQPVSVSETRFFCFFFRSAQEFGRAQPLIGKTIIVRFSNKESARARICSGATRAGVFFYTEIADLCRLGFIYTEFAGRLRVRRMVASGGWSRPENFLGKNLGGRDSARVFGTQRSRIRRDWIVSTQRLPMHWSLRGYNFFSALRADEKGLCICVYNIN